MVRHREIDSGVFGFARYYLDIHGRPSPPHFFLPELGGQVRSYAWGKNKATGPASFTGGDHLERYGKGLRNPNDFFEEKTGGKNIKILPEFWARMPKI